MSHPTIAVYIGFQTTTGFGTPFLLNNSTYGLLNTGTLGGLQFANVTQYVESVNITRGRNRQLDQFNSGTATVSLYNASRIFDPLNTASIYYPNVVPRCPIYITANGITIYSGVITDWNLDYEISNQDMMYVSCADNFTVLSNQQLNTYTPSAESSSARVSNVLARPEITYQGPINITTGSSSLGAYLIDQDTNCLDYLQNVTVSEQGYLFVSGSGVLTFYGRTKVLNNVAAAVFNTTGTGIPYQTLINQFGDELLYNYVVTQSPAGAKQTNSDPTSMALYQSQNYNLLNLLNDSITEVNGLGAYLVGKYSTPVLRFTGLSTLLDALSTTKQNICLGLELTDVVSVEKNFVQGSPSSVTQNMIVSGINHNITPDSHVISYTFESVDGNAYLTLDDTVFGILNQNLLAF